MTIEIIIKETFKEGKRERAFCNGLRLALCAIVLTLMVGPAHAQQTSIDNGLFYLYSTQNPDGSWGGTGTSLNTALQTTATTARTLQLMGITDISLTNSLGYLLVQSPNNIDDLSHQLEVLSASGTNATTWLPP